MSGNLKSLSPAGLRPVNFNLLQRIDHFLILLQIIAQHYVAELFLKMRSDFFLETNPETRINILMCLV